MVDLSIIVLSFNTKEITQDCLRSLLDTLSRTPKLSFEIIVVDNASLDGSPEILKKLPIKTIFLKENLGFGAANNIALKEATGKYILFLNSDVMQKKINYEDLLQYMEDHEDVGVLTARVELESGKIDPASHRGFPTLWRSMMYFLKLENMLGTVPVLNRLVGGYHLTYLPLTTVHEIESPSGAFFLSKKSILDEVGGFDEAFFMYGEDIDLAYRIKHRGYKVIYYPKAVVTHLKYRSGIKTDNTAVKRRIKKHFYRSMRIFYNKHYARSHPGIVNALIHNVINAKIDSI